MSMPYPVLFPEDVPGAIQGYDGGKFEFSDDMTSFVDNDGNRIIEGNLMLEQPELQSLIQSGKAQYAVVVSCPSTMFKKTFFLDDQHIKMQISNCSLVNFVQIQAVIVLREKLTAFDSPHFLGKFHGKKFSLDLGNKLAVSSIHNILLRKGDSAFKHTMIQRISPDFKKKNPHVWNGQIDSSGQDLVIYLDEKSYDACIKLMKDKDYSHFQTLLHDAIYRGMVEIIGDYQKTHGEDCEEEDSQFSLPLWSDLAVQQIKDEMSQQGYAFDINTVELNKNNGINTLCYAVDNGLFKQYWSKYLEREMRLSNKTKEKNSLEDNSLEDNDESTLF